MKNKINSEFDLFDIDTLQTPYYIVSEKLLRENLEKLKYVKDKTGCKILLAQKAFSMYSTYDIIGEYLDGATASGLFEAKLGHDYMKKENHIFSCGYNKQDFDEIIEICDHIIFNSFGQFKTYKDTCVASHKEIGIRINPEFSTGEHDIYDPCAFGSRMGVTLKHFPEYLPPEINGLHFHTLCEQNADDLIKTLEVVCEKFGKYFGQLKWLNFGGGHHITRADYDIEALTTCIVSFKEKYGLQVYLEPGEAVALNAGFLVASVVDMVENGMNIAILDTSAACHMPDVLEMPYRPPIVGSGNPNEKKYTYRLGAQTCLAGDIIGDYSFDVPLNIGDTLIFCDMAHYSMVKNNMFNGINLPTIAWLERSGNIRVVRKFGYEDFKERL